MSKFTDHHNASIAKQLGDDLPWYPLRLERVITDNGPAFSSPAFHPRAFLSSLNAIVEAAHESGAVEPIVK